ncbi:MAG TPA: hypothetical protein VLA49_08355 [Anaerolineales bacterium]|nr:hypothetical protein [Anaerolineales bacterium]
MSMTTLEASTLQGYITDEVFLALGLTPHGGLRPLFEPIFRSATRGFTALAVEFDTIVASHGFKAAAAWLVPRFTREVLVRHADQSCVSGPLLLASNHPGTIDSLVIAANLPRDDLKIIASGIPFLRGLPNVARHLIYAPQDPHGRMGAIRQAIRHLQAGGALQLFASGGIDPDPAVMPGAFAALLNWSRSLEIFLRSVPSTQVVVTIASHVLEPRFLRSPLRFLRRARMDRQRIAEFLQVIRQMVAPGSVKLTPRLSFAEPVSYEKELAAGRVASVRQAIISRAQSQLAEHLSWAASNSDPPGLA